MNHLQPIADKAAYHTPALTAFGALSAVTLSGSGTMVENMSNGVNCVGGTMGQMDLKYPCA